MDADKTETAGDILAAAEARLQAPDPTPATTSSEQPDTPDEGSLPAGPDDDGEPEAPATGPDDEGDPTAPDSAPPLTAAELRELRELAAKGKDAEKSAAALKALLENPAELERLRREYGIKPVEPERAAEPETTTPRGPDPVTNEMGWKHERFNAYVKWLADNKKTAPVEKIQAQVEVDFYQARAERLYQMVQEDRTARETERAEAAKRAEAQKEQREAQEIARSLVPLFKKYPGAATEAGQQDVEDAIIAAVHRNQPVDYEKIVKRVHDRSQAAVREWTDKKRALAGGAAAASARGGSPQGSRKKLADSMPADVSSISEYAERRSRGEV